MLSRLLKQAISKKYKIFYFTLGARTNSPKLLFQQLPVGIRNQGLNVLCIHVSPQMTSSLHISNGLNGISKKSTGRKFRYKKFISNDKKLTMFFVDAFVQPSHINLLEQIVKERNKKGLLSVIGDFLMTGPYDPFTVHLTESLKNLMRLSYVFTLVRADTNVGLGKSKLQKSPTTTSQMKNTWKPPANKQFRSSYNMDKFSAGRHIPLINITETPIRYGYMSPQKIRRDVINLT